MPENTVEIVIEGRDTLSPATRSASSGLAGLQRATSSTSSALGGLTGFLRGAASSALGFGAAMAGLAGISAIGGVVQGTVGRMFELNAETETMRRSFKILMSDAAAMKAPVVASQAEIAEATQSAAGSVVNAQQRMGDAAEDHALAVQKLAEDFAALGRESGKHLAKMAGEYARSLAEMQDNHGRTMAGLSRQLDEYGRAFARQSEERRARFDSEIADRRRRTAEEIADISRRYADQAKTAPDRFLREREAAERNAEFLENAIAEEEGKGVGADQALLASLRTRLAQEEALQQQAFTQFQAREEAEKQLAIRTAKERLETEIATIQERFNREEQAGRESHARQVAELQRAMAAEQAEYAKSLAEKQAKYQDDLATFKEAEAEKLAVLKERQAEEARGYARTVRDAAEAMASAGASYAKAMAGAAQQTGGSVNQLKEMYADLARVTGMATDTEEQRADAMIAFIKEQAKALPLTRREVQASVRNMMAYQINAVQFLGTIANVSAGMGAPLERVTNAFGALATGQVGEAKQRFQEFGISLQSLFSRKEWDMSTGQMAISVESALGRVKDAMDKRFKGMTEEQMKGWTGMTSNMEDAWDAFTEVMGKPIFQEVKKSLGDLLTNIEEHGPQIKEFADALGKNLASVLKDLGPEVEKLMKGFFEWVGSGQAKKDTDEFVSMLRDTVSVVKDIVTFVRDLGKMWKDANGEQKESIVNFQAIDNWVKTVWGDFLRLNDQVALWLLKMIDDMGLMLINAKLLWTTFTMQLGVMWTSLGVVWKGFTDEAGKQFSAFIDSAAVGWQAFTAFAKNAINAVIDYLNSMVNAWNALSFTIPGFNVEIPSVDVPGVGRVGGGNLGWGGINIETPDLPLIPKLDTGGIVSRPTLAALAMNSRPEAVIPLNGGGNGIIDYGRLAAALQMQPIIVQIDGEEIVVRGYERARRRGRL